MGKKTNYEALFYSEGSQACRNYSQLTMKVRTLSQHVLIGALIALSVATIGSEPKNYLWQIFLYGGIVLGLFSISLALVDWHYQSAFTAIRNVLVHLEGDKCGPWRAHEFVRTGEANANDFIASYFPFWVIWLLGLASFLGGFFNDWHSSWWMFAIGLLFAAVELLIFIYIGVYQGNIDIKNLCKNNQEKKQKI